jgi:hypothetical protein
MDTADTARELTIHLADLLRRERGAMSDFLVALADFDARKLWRDLGHATLFSFLRRELGLSAGAAQYRKTAAELIQRYPEVEAALRTGDLCLSSIVELAKVVTPESVSEILPRFHRLSSREAALVAVSIRPVENAPTREVVTAVRAATIPAVATTISRRAFELGASAADQGASAVGAPVSAASPSAATAPATPAGNSPFRTPEVPKGQSGAGSLPPSRSRFALARTVELRTRPEA